MVVILRLPDPSSQLTNRTFPFPTSALRWSTGEPKVRLPSICKKVQPCQSWLMEDDQPSRLAEGIQNLIGND